METKVRVTVTWVYGYDLPEDALEDGRLSEALKDEILEDFDMTDRPDSVDVTVEAVE